MNDAEEKLWRQKRSEVANQFRKEIVPPPIVEGDPIGSLLTLVKHYQLAMKRAFTVSLPTGITTMPVPVSDLLTVANDLYHPLFEFLCAQLTDMAAQKAEWLQQKLDKCLEDLEEGLEEASSFRLKDPMMEARRGNSIWVIESKIDQAFQTLKGLKRHFSKQKPSRPTLSGDVLAQKVASLSPPHLEVWNRLKAGPIRAKDYGAKGDASLIPKRIERMIKMGLPIERTPDGYLRTDLAK